MLTPHPPRSPHPSSGKAPRESDELIAGPLRAGSDAEASRSAALLMARHWEPVQDYAVICLAVVGPLAHLVTAAAFHQVLDRLALGESGEALRPRLLVAVRDTVVNWSRADRIATVLPGLEKPAGGRGMRAARTLIPENRALSDHSFHGLARPERTLLWHIEVEAEPVSVPADLLGMEDESATTALERAREKFREGLVCAHRELAPSKECRYYNRLLDAPLRRGGALLPDVQEHLVGCVYCRHAAEQLGQADAALGVLLAEAVLGWGARRYLDSRPGRRQLDPTRTPGGSRGSGGRRQGGAKPGLLTRALLPRVLRRGDGTTESRAPAAAHRALGQSDGAPGPFAPTAGRTAARLPLGEPGPARSSRMLLIGVGMVSAGLLAAALVINVWPHGGSGTGPVASPTSAGAPSPSATATAPGWAVRPATGRPTRLRNAAAGLCLDIKGRPEVGASAVLADCSSAVTQRWAYETGGLLRSSADSGLCLDSHADAGVVILGRCTGTASTRGDDVRYDLTPQGELLPRWDQELALANAGVTPGADLVVKVRDRSAGQRWLTDPPSASPRSVSIAGTNGPFVQPAERSDRYA
ncbi:hydrolase [Streptomyces pluripotens]|uniref:Hydrolase n=1 Tax=Streptomyces pluripotens TaxID=1355015 RepID=A0A221NSW3_9ACTN|nr:MULTISPECIES: RICIN domain-containing protein [Streptomyces]ARP68768.1 hydrolase [Streptomyces pluripotens]ASN23024.1 hydrolase [Streptomyces pluripotens]KIE27836.1 hydrolase [Streptomyces sp. MUSC 125]